jgi:hypothetical protein
VQVAETKLNTDSSRSHSVFTIKLCTVPKEHVVPYEQVKENPGRYVRYTKLSVIDLVWESKIEKKKKNSFVHLTVSIGWLRESQTNQQHWKSFGGSFQHQSESLYPESETFFFFFFLFSPEYVV